MLLVWADISMFNIFCSIFSAWWWLLYCATRGERTAISSYISNGNDMIENFVDNRGMNFLIMFVDNIGKIYKLREITSKALTFLSISARYWSLFSLDFCAETRFDRTLQRRNDVNVWIIMECSLWNIKAEICNQPKGKENKSWYIAQKNIYLEKENINNNIYIVHRLSFLGSMFGSMARAARIWTPLIIARVLTGLSPEEGIAGSVARSLVVEFLLSNGKDRFWDSLLLVSADDDEMVIASEGLKGDLVTLLSME